MNELIELLEMQQDLDNLIQEAVGELTVGEFQTLQESGVLNEAATKPLSKILRRVGTATGILKMTPAERVQMVNRVAKQAARSQKDALGKVIAPAVMKDMFRNAYKNQKGIVKATERPVRLATTAAAGTAAYKTGQFANNKVKNRSMLSVYKETGNAVTACKSRYSKPEEVKACAQKLYAAAKAGKLTKLKDIVKDRM